MKPLPIFTRSALAAALLASASANAALIQFTDLTAFNAATTGNVVEDYTAPPASFINLGNTTLNGISYPAYAFAVDPAYSPGFYQWNSGAILLLNNNATLGFPAATAFAADFGTILPTGATVTVTINGIANVITTAPRPALTFYGWTSDEAITSVSITSGASNVVLDNVTRALAVPPVDVAEPAPLALLGLGLLALAWRRRPHR